MKLTIVLLFLQKNKKMKLETKNIDKALSKAYLAQNPYINEIGLFKEHYTTLLKSIKPTDNEETLKDYINDFLKNTYYKGKFFTKENINNIDLAILNGNNVDDKIGVIIETKAIKNVAEMITKTDLNKKAFQELIQYYLEERITNSNIEIKHLIITNSIEWFVFNATEFERIFYQNKQLQKSFIDWSTGKLVSKNKDWFYNEIAKPFIENSEETIICTHFSLPNLSDFQNLTDLKLIELYKIFSPEHLLKLPFQNDSNTLNQDFYNELLHIIGLYETKDNSKTIERLKENNRNEGSLLENVISIIENDDILQQLRNLPDFENLADLGSEEEQIFSIALELCITWVNRIIFLKLLESQLLKYNDNNQDYKFLNSEKITDFESLKELFFEVLAKDTNERKKGIKEKYKNIPYLNSSLFEQTELEKTAVKINHLKQHAELPVFSQTVLKDENEKSIIGTKPVLNYLLDFLDSYNFASDKRVEIQEKNKTLINSSVLGLIFEKLNGYKEGSFYTPGYVTMYICRETIRNAVIQKFRNLNFPSFKNLESFTDLYNQIGKISLKQANQIFNSIRICDPAVGSGHFLVSALNELIAIKSELGILIDNDGQTLRNTYCEVENDELYITHFNGLFVYNFKDKESRRIQETIFKEKRNLIEDCLFGVDINPKSVQICRLRLWIELLKNAYYIIPNVDALHATHLHLELETLPNIDINIKCGNSLVSRFSLNGNMQKNGILSKMQYATRQYKEQVVLYKCTDNKKVKKEAEKKILELKEQFATIANPYDDELKGIRLKEDEIKNKPILFTREEQIAWNNQFVELTLELDELNKNYRKKLRSIYTNSCEWRFEFPELLDDNGNFTGFDVVVGNPPYGIFNKKQNQRTSLKTIEPIIDYYKTHYKPAIEGMINASKLFYLLGLNLLKTDGINGMIIPYGFLADVSSSKLRRYIFENHSIIKIDAFPERDNPAKRIFEEAKISTAIVITKKCKSQIDFELGVSYNKDFSKERIRLTFGDIKKLSGEKLTIPLINQQKLNVLLKIATSTTIQLKELSECLTGEVDISLAKNAITDKKTIYPLVKGVQIDRYTFKLENEEISQGKIQYLDLRKFEKIYTGKKLSHSQNKRIVLQGLTGVNEKRRIKATLINENYYLANSCNYILINESINHKFLLALLNSKLFNFIFKCKSTNSNVNGYEINELPIILTSETSKIEKIIDKIIENKEKNIHYDSSKEEAKIDNEIYKLYNLTKEEIEIIENETA